MSPQRSRGFSLIELIISIVVLSIGVGAIMLLFTAQAVRSVDPLLQEQALAIAEAYLEEIRLQSFADPDGLDTEGASREIYDDVDDYLGLPDDVVRDRSGAAIAALQDYAVTVAVEDFDLGGLGSGNAWKIEVRVAHRVVNDIDLLLTGIRARY